MMRKRGLNTGMVLQGYFRLERFRAPASRAAGVQPKPPTRLAPQPPRPELLPAAMRGGTAQAKVDRGAGRAWSGAPRPELLPSMRPSRVGPQQAIQARPSHGVSTPPIPARQLRVIGEGRPLESGIRQAMERLFDADFSGVRVSTWPSARPRARSSRASAASHPRSRLRSVPVWTSPCRSAPATPRRAPWPAPHGSGDEHRPAVDCPWRSRPRKPCLPVRCRSVSLWAATRPQPVSDEPRRWLNETTVGLIPKRRATLDDRRARSSKRRTAMWRR